MRFTLKLTGPRAWRNGLRTPIFIPHELDGIRELLANGQTEIACRQLWKSTQLGSTSAAAVLGFLYYSDIKWEELPPAEVEAACRRAASRRCAYAEYVVALIELERRNSSKAWVWLHRANKQQFGAALVETALLTRFAVGKPGIALRYLRRGMRLWHIPSLVVFIGNSALGLYGLWWRIVGLVALPLTAVVVTIALHYFPFSERVFVETKHFGKKRSMLQAGHEQPPDRV